jgi:carbamoyl-phosphate synthase large subunit
VEFDYCCVRAVMALREQGYETIMINSYPETVSTDFDTSDKLYFEPLTLEDVLEIVQREQPMGVIVQLGGQTPLKLTRGLERAGVTILGTSPDDIDAAEDRRRFEAIAREVGLTQPPSGTATSVEEALAAASRIGYPVLVRPSYVLGGRAMQIVYDPASLEDYFATAARVSEERPVLIDSFLEDAFEADVDALSDGTNVVIGGVMQHIEDAGIHSGDSACVLPPYIIGERDLQTMREQTVAMAKAFHVVGLINVQFAVKNGIVYVLEVNPRASRTVPFVSKAIGVPLASHAARLMCGETLEDVGFTEEIIPPFVSVKEDMPRSYLPDERPGMMVAKVAFTTFAFRPSAWTTALARSASMPTTVLPSEPMNSFGA